MVSIEEALRIINQQPVSLTAENVPVQEALGSYLAEKIISPFDLPSFDNSAMDGYAVCGFHETYTIIGEVAAGDVSSCMLQEGQAMRIFTGGKIPENTTAVVMQEKISLQGDALLLEEATVQGSNLRKRGTELAKGSTVFKKGEEINAAAVGLLSSLGYTSVPVYKKPTVSLIATGNELISPGTALQEGQIYESNTQALRAACAQYGFEVKESLQIADDLPLIEKGIGDALRGCDLLLLSGGISVGEYDFVKRALEANGVEEQFYKVYQKPGKPLYFGKTSGTFVFALPGNPASSLTCFYVYVLPLLEKLAGGVGAGLPRLSLPLSGDYNFKLNRPTFLKASIANGEVGILEGQGSSMVHSMAIGNALVFLDEPKHLTKGTSVPCIPIS